MKDKIMFLIIGVLIGAIITTVGFLIYNKSLSNNMDEPKMNQNGQMQPPSNDNMGEPPAKPDGENGEEPPAKPDDLNSNNVTN